MIAYTLPNIMDETIENYSYLLSDKIERSLSSSIESISIEKIINKAAIGIILATSLSAGQQAPHKEPFIYLPIEQSLSLPDGVSMGRAWINSTHPWQDILDIDQEKPFLAMYKVSSSIDGLLSDGKYALIDNALSSLDVNLTSVGFLISILSSTYYAKSHLPSRPYFFQKVSTRVVTRGENKPGLLDGLF